MNKIGILVLAVGFSMLGMHAYGETEERRVSDIEFKLGVKMDRDLFLGQPSIGIVSLSCRAYTCALTHMSFPRCDNPLYKVGDKNLLMPEIKTWLSGAGELEVYREGTTIHARAKRSFRNERFDISFDKEKKPEHPGQRIPNLATHSNFSGKASSEWTLLDKKRKIQATLMPASESQSMTVYTFSELLGGCDMIALPGFANN